MIQLYQGYTRPGGEVSNHVGYKNKDRLMPIQSVNGSSNRGAPRQGGVSFSDATMSEKIKRAVAGFFSLFMTFVSIGAAATGGGGEGASVWANHLATYANNSR